MGVPNDLSARLRRQAKAFGTATHVRDELTAAADLIDQQAAEIERLRDIVGQFRAHYPMGINPWLDDAYRAALKERPHG